MKVFSFEPILVALEVFFLGIGQFAVESMFLDVVVPNFLHPTTERFSADSHTCSL